MSKINSLIEYKWKRRLFTTSTSLAAFIPLLLGGRLCFADHYYTLDSSSHASSATAAYTNDSIPWHVSQYAIATDGTTVSAQTLTFSGSGLAFAGTSLDECSSCSGGQNPITEAAAWASGLFKRDSEHDDDTPVEVNMALNVAGAVDACSHIHATGGGSLTGSALAHAEAYAGSTLGTNKATVDINSTVNSGAPAYGGCTTNSYQTSSCDGSGCCGHSEFGMSCSTTYYPTSKNFYVYAKIYCRAEGHLYGSVGEAGRIWGSAGGTAYAGGSITITAH